MCVQRVGQRPRCTKRGALCVTCAPYSTGCVCTLLPLLMCVQRVGQRPRCTKRGACESVRWISVNVCAACWAKAAMHKTRCVVCDLRTLQHGVRVYAPASVYV